MSHESPKPPTSLFTEIPTLLLTDYTQRPVYKNESVLKGKLKLKTQAFYQLDKANRLVKFQPEFDIIFDTKVREREND